MPLTPNAPNPSPANYHSRYQRVKASFRKKVIAPISSEAEILAATNSHKRAFISATTHTISPPLEDAHATKTPADHRYRFNSTDRSRHLISGSQARINSQIELELLSSSLDRKNRRLKHILAFLGQVLFWAAATYVIIL